MRTRIFTSFFIMMCSALILLSVAPEFSPGFAEATNPDDAGCLKCHEGIEPIADTPVMSELACTQCHMGNPEGESKEDAHKGMYSNPADFRVVDRTCGECHEEDVSNSLKSMHATMAGMISGTDMTGRPRIQETLYTQLMLWKIRTEMSRTKKGR